MVRTRMWRGGRLESKDFPVDEISDHIKRDDRFVWVDFTNPTAEDLAVVENELGVHELAAEDALERGQRPKLDRYREGLFVVAYDVLVADREAGLATHEVKAFVTERALVTMHEDTFDMDEVVTRWDENADLARHGVSYLLWGVLDVLADHAAATVEQLEDLVEDLEDDLFDVDSRTSQVQRRSFTIRKSLGVVRRRTGPMRDVLQSLLRGDAEDVSDGIRPYFRDVADHLTGVVDTADQLREAVSSVLDTNLNLASNRQNDVMKKVTSWAAIIAIPTAITGFFGQNVLFPGEGRWSGLAISITLIVVTSSLLYRAFKRRDWL